MDTPIFLVVLNFGVTGSSWGEWGTFPILEIETEIFSSPIFGDSEHFFKKNIKSYLEKEANKRFFISEFKFSESRNKFESGGSGDLGGSYKEIYFTTQLFSAENFNKIIDEKLQESLRKHIENTLKELTKAA